MTNTEKVDSNIYVDFMAKNNLTLRQISAMTGSSYNSVLRWKHTGVPTAKFNLLKLQVEKNVRA